MRKKKFNHRSIGHTKLLPAIKPNTKTTRSSRRVVGGCRRIGNRLRRVAEKRIVSMENKFRPIGHLGVFDLHSNFGAKISESDSTYISN